MPLQLGERARPGVHPDLGSSSTQEVAAAGSPRPGVRGGGAECAECGEGEGEGEGQCEGAYVSAGAPGPGTRRHGSATRFTGGRAERGPPAATPRPPSRPAGPSLPTPSRSAGGSPPRVPTLSPITRSSRDSTPPAPGTTGPKMSPRDGSSTEAASISYATCRAAVSGAYAWPVARARSQPCTTSSSAATTPAISPGRSSPPARVWPVHAAGSSQLSPSSPSTFGSSVRQPDVAFRQPGGGVGVRRGAEVLAPGVPEGHGQAGQMPEQMTYGVLRARCRGFQLLVAHLLREACHDQGLRPQVQGRRCRTAVGHAGLLS